VHICALLPPFKSTLVSQTLAARCNANALLFTPRGRIVLQGMSLANNIGLESYWLYYRLHQYNSGTVSDACSSTIAYGNVLWVLNFCILIRAWAYWRFVRSLFTVVCCLQTLCACRFTLTLNTHNYLFIVYIYSVRLQAVEYILFLLNINTEKWNIRKMCYIASDYLFSPMHTLLSNLYHAT
jgi:hypothetical protein